MTEQALAVHNGFTEDAIALIKQTVAVGASDLELTHFLAQCQRTGLDPVMKQIHFVKRKDTKTGQYKGTYQVGIDGYRLIADRTRAYAGSDDPIYRYGDTGGLDIPVSDKDKPYSATVTVYKIVQGHRCPFTATARWDEYKPPQGNDFIWTKMPHTMLSKCAESLALRKAFPQELSGLYTHEEMDQAGGPIIDVQTGEVQDDPDGPTYGKRAPDDAEETKALAEAAGFAVAAVEPAPAFTDGITDAQLRAIRAHLRRTGRPEQQDLTSLTREEAADVLRDLSKQPNAS